MKRIIESQDLINSSQSAGIPVVAAALLKNIWTFSRKRGSLVKSFSFPKDLAAGAAAKGRMAFTLKADCLKAALLNAANDLLNIMNS